jgi:hypothetical protein
MRGHAAPRRLVVGPPTAGPDDQRRTSVPDPENLDVSEADAVEQLTPVVDDGPDPSSGEVPLDANPADVNEQRTTVAGESDDLSGDLPAEADPADVAEQRRGVPGDDHEF